MEEATDNSETQAAHNHEEEDGGATLDGEISTILGKKPKNKKSKAYVKKTKTEILLTKLEKEAKAAPAEDRFSLVFEYMKINEDYDKTREGIARMRRHGDSLMSYGVEDYDGGASALWNAILSEQIADLREGKTIEAA